MATNKHAIIRYQTLDKCFRNNGRRYFIEDLVDECSKAISEYAGNNSGVKKRQVFEDIKFMESEAGYSISLNRIKENRKVYYRYEDTNFSINSQPISEIEANQLRETLSTLNRFKGLPQFGWINEISARLENSFSLSTNKKNVIQFESNEFVEGQEHIEDLYNAIIYEKVIEIEYQSFKDVPLKSFIISPYLLKQYNNRWFLFGSRHGANDLSNFPLDRIKKIKLTDIEYQPTSIDLDEYFEDIVGVTSFQDRKPETFKIECKEQLLPYIITKPIHGSQKIKGNTVELELIPNYEFESKLLSFGESIKIIEPESFRLHMKDRIKKILANY